METIEHIFDKKKDASQEGKDLEMRMAEKEQELRNMQTKVI